MHILIIPSWYKSIEQPMYAPFIEEQARMLQRSGFQIGIIYPNWSGSFLNRWKKKRSNSKIYLVLDKGIPTYYCNINSIVPIFDSINFYFINNIINKIYLKYENEYGKPDIIHAHSSFLGGVVADFLSKKHKIPFFITEHASKLITNPVKGLNKLLIRKIFNNASKVLTVSCYQQDKLSKIYHLPINKFYNLPNTVNPIFFDFPNDLAKPKSDLFTFIIVGNLKEIKNHSLLFYSFKDLLYKKKHVKLVVVGEGSLKEYLVNLAKNLGILDSIIFTGSLSRLMVKKEIQNSHVLISTSKTETFGINLIEALALGKPVIATDSGGPRDIIEETDGILVKEHTPEALENAMINIINNYNNYDPKLIIEKCKKRFSEEVIVQKLLSVYNLQ